MKYMVKCAQWSNFVKMVEYHMRHGNNCEICKISSMIVETGIK